MAAVVGVLLAAEVALRAWHRATGAPYDPSALRSSIEGRVAAMGERVGGVGDDIPQEKANQTFLHPYHGYETATGFDAVSWQLEYVRSGKAAARQASGGAYLVLIVGGSVAQIFGSPTNGGVGRFRELL